MAKKIKCYGCGLKSKAGTKFCSECGRRITPKLRQNGPVTPKSPTPRRTFIRFIATLLAFTSALLLTALFAVTFFLLELSYIIR